MEEISQSPIQTPLEARMPTENITEEKKKKTVLFYINIVLLLIVLGLGAYILYKEGYWAKTKEQEKIETEDALKKDKEIEEVEKEPETKDFAGTYIKAKLPEDWDIEEYSDGEGTDTVTEGSKVVGLTGLEIKKGGTVILKLKALEGYGSNDCSQIAHFKDFSQEYEEDKKEMAEETGHTVTFLDFTKTPYTEINLFGIKTRRVEKAFFYDTIEGDSYFQPQCLTSVLIFDNLKFIVGEGAYQTSNGDYSYSFSGNVTIEELNLLDDILKSMSII